MNYNDEKIVRPIFQAMINNLPEMTIKKIFFEIGESSYFKYLPKDIREEPNFIKEAISKEMIEVNDLPDEFKNSKFLSKEKYLNLLKEDPELLSLNIYPQDKEIVITALSNTKNDIFDLVETEFKKDEEVLSEIIKKSPEHLYHIETNLAQKIRKNVGVMSVLISNDPQMFHELKEKEKSESAYLKLMLKNIPNFNEVKEYLSANKDSEIALMAVKLTKKSIPYLHPSFQKIINQCEDQKDIYTFLKIQLLNEKNRNSQNAVKTLNNNL
jgi:hypothetical protein